MTDINTDILLLKHTSDSLILLKLFFWFIVQGKWTQGEHSGKYICTTTDK